LEGGEFSYSGGDGIDLDVTDGRVVEGGKVGFRAGRLKAVQQEMATENQTIHCMLTAPEKVQHNTPKMVQLQWIDDIQPLSPSGFPGKAVAIRLR
jgi:hypothetical protein